MKTPKKRPKLSALQAKADKVMSQYIRMKYADQSGLCKCVSCGQSKPWTEMDAGHFVPKSRGASIRYIEENVHPECPGCNRFNDGHLIGYTRYMIDMYGVEKIEELQAAAKRTLSASSRRAATEEAIQYFSQKLAEIDT